RRRLHPLRPRRRGGRRRDARAGGGVRGRARPRPWARGGAAPRPLRQLRGAAPRRGARPGGPRGERGAPRGAARPPATGAPLPGPRPAPHPAAPLRPAMTLRTRVVALRPARRGDAVGYSALYRAPRATRIATLPLGYADGVPIAASNRGAALIRGRRHPFAGRVSMDFVTVGVGDAPVEIGDEAILFGTAERGALPVEEAAAAAGTIAYELFVRVGARVRRAYAE